MPLLSNIDKQLLCHTSVKIGSSIHDFAQLSKRKVVHVFIYNNVRLMLLLFL